MLSVGDQVAWAQQAYAGSAAVLGILILTGHQSAVWLLAEVNGGESVLQSRSPLRVWALAFQSQFVSSDSGQVLTQGLCYENLPLPAPEGVCPPETLSETHRGNKAKQTGALALTTDS